MCACACVRVRTECVEVGAEAEQRQGLVGQVDALGQQHRPQRAPTGGIGQEKAQLFVAQAFASTQVQLCMLCWIIYVNKLINIDKKNIAEYIKKKVVTKGKKRTVSSSGHVESAMRMSSPTVMNGWECCGWSGLPVAPPDLAPMTNGAKSPKRKLPRLATNSSTAAEEAEHHHCQCTHTNTLEKKVRTCKGRKLAAMHQERPQPLLEIARQRHQPAHVRLHIFLTFAHHRGARPLVGAAGLGSVN